MHICETGIIRLTLTVWQSRTNFFLRGRGFLFFENKISNHKNWLIALSLSTQEF